MDVDQWIQTNEGFRDRVYDDATGKPIVPGSVVVGHPTIGFGRCLDTHGILRNEGELLYRNNKADAEADLQIIFGAQRWANFGLPRQGVLTDIRFEIGSKGFRGFHQMITAACNGEWEKAAAALLDSKLAMLDSPDRQIANAAVLRSGEWPA